MTEILWNKVNVNRNDAVCYDENTEKEIMFNASKQDISNRLFQLPWFSVSSGEKGMKEKWGILTENNSGNTCIIKNGWRLLDMETSFSSMEI